MLHVLDDPWSALAAIRDLVAPGGALFVSMLVSDAGGAINRRYLKMLRRRGEFGPLRTTEDFTAAAKNLLGPDAKVTRTGSMAYLRARR